MDEVASRVSIPGREVNHATSAAEHTSPREVLDIENPSFCHKTQLIRSLLT